MPIKPAPAQPLSVGARAELAGLRHRLHAEIVRCRRLEADYPDLPPLVRHDLVTLDLVAGKLAGLIRQALEEDPT